MQKLDLKLLMSEAKENTKQIEKLEGDWKTQIEVLKRIVGVVTTYQKAINKAFKEPDGWKKDGSFFHLPLGVISMEEVESIRDLRFEGAALIQAIDVEHLSQGTRIAYAATLKLDESWFLGQMLPEIQKLHNADPDYTIYDFEFMVPKGELVSESLHLMNDKINEALAEEDATPPESRAPTNVELVELTLARERLLQQFRGIGGIGTSGGVPSIIPAVHDAPAPRWFAGTHIARRRSHS